MLYVLFIIVSSLFLYIILRTCEQKYHQGYSNGVYDFFLLMKEDKHHELVEECEKIYREYE